MKHYCLVLLSFAVGVAWAQTDDAEAPIASVDRPAITLGESFTLSLLDRTASGGQPNLAELATDFEVLSQASSTQMLYREGRPERISRWEIELAPKRIGTLRIPAISIGSRSSDALAIEVREPQPPAPGQQPDLLVELLANNRAPYLGQEVMITVRLLYDLTLTEGNLDDLAIADARIEKVGEDNSYQTQRGGRSYRAIERQYLVTFDRSGDVTVPAIVFRGRALNGSRASRRLFAGRGETVSAISQMLELQVKAPPGAAPRPWLPASEVSMTATLSEPTVRVGQPTTIQLRQRTVGVSPDHLQPFSWPAIDGARTYPEQAETSSYLQGEQRVVERVHRLAVVPQQAGALTIPPMTLAWFDTDLATASSASSAPIVIDVQPAAVTGQAAAAGTAERVLLPAEPAATAVDRRWQFAAIGLGMALLVTWLVIIARTGWHRRPLRQRRQQQQNTVRKARAAAVKAQRRGDIAALAVAIRAWSSAAQQPNAGDLLALAAASKEKNWAVFLQRLDAARHGTASATQQALLDYQLPSQWPTAVPAPKTRAQSPLDQLYAGI